VQGQDPGPDPSATPQEEPKRRTRRSRKQMIADAQVPPDGQKVEVKFVSTGSTGKRTWEEARRLRADGKVEFPAKELEYAFLKVQQAGTDAVRSAKRSEADEYIAGREVREDSDGNGAVKVGQSEDQVQVADVLGGHQRYVSVEEWRGWKVLSHGEPSTGKVDPYHGLPRDESGQVQAPEGAGHGDVVEVAGGDEERYVGPSGVLIARRDDTMPEEYFYWTFVEGQWRCKRGDSGGAPRADDGAESGRLVSELISEDPRRGFDPMAGDQVRVGIETYFVGHGDKLTKLRPVRGGSGEPMPLRYVWQRGADGWRRVDVAKPSEDLVTSSTANGAAASSTTLSEAVGAPPRTETIRQAPEVQQVDVLTWKISTGVLEKIGLPDYSGLQVGPLSVQRYVVDDGRRTTVQLLSGREASIPTSVVEAYREANDTVEFVAREIRGQILSFLEAVKPGSTQPA
jgi:hypothetical protein